MSSPLLSRLRLVLGSIGLAGAAAFGCASTGARSTPLPERSSVPRPVHQAASPRTNAPDSRSLTALVRTRARCLRDAEQGRPCSIEHVSALNAAATRSGGERTATETYIATMNDPDPYVVHVASSEVMKPWVDRRDEFIDSISTNDPSRSARPRPHLVCRDAELARSLVESAPQFTDRTGSFPVNGLLLGDLLGCVDFEAFDLWGPIEKMLRGHASSSLRSALAESLARHHPQASRVLTIIRELAKDRNEREPSSFVYALLALAETTPAVTCAELAALTVENAGTSSRIAEEAFGPKAKCGPSLLLLATTKAAPGWTPSAYVLGLVRDRCANDPPEDERRTLEAFAATWAAWEKRTSAPKPHAAAEAHAVCRASKNVRFIER